MSGLQRRTGRTPLMSQSPWMGPEQAAAHERRESSAMPFTRKLRPSRIVRPILLVVAGVLVFFLVLSRQSQAIDAKAYADWAAYYDRLADKLAQLRLGTSTKRLREANEPYGEFECNPFTQIGKLIVDEEHPRRTGWVPYDRNCHASSYFRHLFRTDDSGPMIPSHTAQDDEEDFDGSTFTGPRRHLPWLHNKTILFVGDSIDRYVLKDICEHAKGNLFNVHNEHPAAPASYHKTHIPEFDRDGKETEESRERFLERQKLEQQWDNRGRASQELTNPWVCDLTEYDATLVNVFTFGYEGGEQYFKDEHWYHAPAGYIDRLHYIAKPLLKNLARHLNRPQIEKPDLVTTHAAYWNLRKYAEEDFIAAGFPSRPYPEDNPIVFTNLSPEREQALESETRKSLVAIARAFRGPDGRIRNGPMILWRSMHQTLRHNYAPWSRTFETDSLIRHLIAGMQDSSRSRVYSKDDYGFDERLRIDEFGPLLRGQQHLFRDLGHPNFIPGSWLRADILLYELKRAVLGIGRSGSKKKLGPSL